MSSSGAAPKAQVVLMDYGGVLGDHHQDPAESTLASILGVDKQRCRSLLSERSEQGAAFREDVISEQHFWSVVFGLAGLERRYGPPDAILSRLWAETYSLNKEVLAILQAIRRRVPVGVLTNIDRARSDYLVNVVGLLPHIDIYLPSFRFKAIKPKEALWRSADADIKAAFGEDTAVLYIDDRTTHVRACAVVGWEGVLYQNVPHIAEELRARQLISHEILSPLRDGGLP